MRLGGKRETIVDVRVVSATNADMKTALAEGRFREDLYFRLGIVVLSLPPLRNREGDIPLLAKVLLQKYSAEMKKKVTGFTKQAVSAIEFSC